MLHVISVLEQRCDEIVKEKNRIACYLDMIKKERHRLLTTKADKALQTEFESERFLVDECAEKQNIPKSAEQKVESGTCRTAGSEEEDGLDGKKVQQDSFVSMWKDTRTERKEIDHMKRRGQEIRSNLEKRLKVINDLVKRTGLHKEEESEVRAWQGGPTGTTLNTNTAELQQLKVRMLHEVDKLQSGEVVGGKTTRCDKANQTVQTDARGQGTARRSAGMVQESEASMWMNSRFLGQLRHYCCHCCCHCCDCWENVDTEEQSGDGGTA